MGALLTTASTLNCPHGGTVTASPGSTTAQAGAPIVRVSDTFSIAGCTFQVSGAPHPCVSVNWSAPAAQVKHGGDPALTDSSVGLCVAGDQAPQGSVMVASTQAKVAGR